MALPEAIRELTETDGSRTVTTIPVQTETQLASRPTPPPRARSDLRGAHERADPLGSWNDLPDFSREHPGRFFSGQRPKNRQRIQDLGGRREYDQLSLGRHLFDRRPRSFERSNDAGAGPLGDLRLEGSRGPPWPVHASAQLGEFCFSPQAVTRAVRGATRAWRRPNRSPSRLPPPGRMTNSHNCANSTFSSPNAR